MVAFADNPESPLLSRVSRARGQWECVGWSVRYCDNPVETSCLEHSVAPERSQLGSCSKDPIGYIDGANLYQNYFAMNATDPTGLSWATENFVLHYWFGWGAPVDLDDVGLGDAFWGHSSVKGAIDRFKQDIVAALFERMSGLDCEAYSWTHTYSGRRGYVSDVTWSWTMFPIGESALKFSGACKITVGACDEECDECRDFALDCEFDYTLRDSFEDPFDFEEWGWGTLEVDIPYEIRSSRNERLSTSGNTCESGGDPELVPWTKRNEPWTW